VIRLSHLLALLKHRMNKKRSNCILVHGKKGKGKSYLSLRLCELLDKDFSIDKVCFSAEDFTKLINTKLKPGSCVVYDEVGVGTNSRDSQTRQNKNMSFIAQTIRPYAITVFFTTISRGLVDCQVINLMDYEIRAEGYDALDETSTFKFFVVEPSQVGNDPLKKHLVFASEGKPVKHVSWTCSIPEYELRTTYDKLRDKYMTDLFAASAENTKKKEKRKDTAAERYKDEKVKDMIAKGASIRKIASEFGVSQSTAHLWKTNVVGANNKIDIRHPY